MNPGTTAILLIGYQNDYFASDGILRGVLENQQRTDDVLRKTVHLLTELRDSETMYITTPIIFSPDYSEVRQGEGILATIKEVGAFQQGQPGSETVAELAPLQDRVIEIPGKRGMNAFAGTALTETLRTRPIEDIVLAGAVTSICIDSTARSAYEQGWRVTILEDCTAGRTDAEQEFFCSTVFPTYGTVTDATTLLQRLSSSV